LTPLFHSMEATQLVRIKDWPHAPVHRLDSRGVYMVTGATLHKQRLFGTHEALDRLEDQLLTLAKKYELHLHAWSVFSNHYHLIARSIQETPQLKEFLSHLHTKTASELNRLDDASGRSVCYNFWDTKLTYERSYLARLTLCSSKSRKSWIGYDSESVSMVLSGVV